MQTIHCNDGTKLEVGDEEYSQFRDWLTIDEDLSQRISELFWLDMFVGYRRSSLDCIAVLNTIKNLEIGELPNGVRPATPFERKPLIGLWHKQYYSGANLSYNVVDELEEGDPEGIFERVKDENIDAGEQSKQFLGKAMKLVRRSLKNRAEDPEKGLTGEWIIFTITDTGNLYLSLGYHYSGHSSKQRDQFLIDRIKKYCVPEFPDALAFVE